MQQNTEKARQEIQEIEKISRSSLSQIREVVSDYRQRDLATELSQARILLNSLDIKVNEEFAPTSLLNLTTEQNTVLAFIVRELATNIMRHSRATECTLKLTSNNQHTVLTISNNGPVRNYSEGSGLKGIRERVEKVGGQADFRNDSGFVANITIPVL